MRLLIALSFLILTMPAWAQLYTSTSDNISEDDAHALFSDLKKENAKMSQFSECFQRAHIWSLRAERVHNITMEKVYLFFTYKFQMQHIVKSRWGRAFTWWFHVAPAVRVNGELWVMDATFTDKAMPLQQWARSLMKTPQDCVELRDPLEYVSARNSTNGYRNLENASTQCYYTNAPKYIYQPAEIGYKEGGNATMLYTVPSLATPEDWRPHTLIWAVDAYKKKSDRRAARQALGF